MCAPASLNELIMQFFLYLLQLLRSGGLKGNSVQLLQAVIFRPRCCWVVASLRSATSYFGIHLLNPPLQSNPPLNPVHTVPIQMLFLNITEFMGSASVKRQKMSQEFYLAEFTREHMPNRAAQKWAESTAHTLAFTSPPFEISQLFHVPFYISYFFQEHRGMFLSTAVTHFINNWLCQPLMNKSSRGKENMNF